MLPCAHKGGLGHPRAPCRMGRRSSQLAAVPVSRSGCSTLIKICGVTNPEDARLAAQAGADFIGMIMWPRAKRSVSDITARQIADVAREHGAQAVGVFVDETAAVMTARCRLAGIPIAQLHGDAARASFPGIPEDLQVVYVVNCQPDGTPATVLPAGLGAAPASTDVLLAADAPRWQLEWSLLDGMQGGSGQALDWTRLRSPAAAAHAQLGWLLAGGLTPDNVAEAVRLARPSGVDVSSGVCGPDGLQKDAGKVRAFIAAVQGVAA